MLTIIMRMASQNEFLGETKILSLTEFGCASKMNLSQSKIRKIAYNCQFDWLPGKR